MPKQPIINRRRECLRTGSCGTPGPARPVVAPLHDARPCRPISAPQLRVGGQRARSRPRASRCPPAAPPPRPPRARICAASPATEPMTGLARGQVLEHLRRDERREQRHVAQRHQADVGGREQRRHSPVGTPGSSVTLPSPSSATRRCSRWLVGAVADEGEIATAARSARQRGRVGRPRAGACAIPCVPAYSTRQSSGPAPSRARSRGARPGQSGRRNRSSVDAVADRVHLRRRAPRGR